MEYQGTHDVSTNIPALIDGTGSTGDVYRISVGGTRDYGSGNQTAVAGDEIIYNGTIWEVSINSYLVNSVNSQQGVVVLDADDVSDAATTNKYTTAGEISKLAGIETGATADQTDAEIKIAYENNANTNAFTDAEQTNLSNQSGTNTGDELAATTTLAGIVEIATTSEVNTGTDNDRAVSPLSLASSQLQIDVTANNAKVSADGPVTTHSDVTDAGSGIIISVAERTKLDGIEALADVTDATNVDAAGATMNTDATLVGNAYFLDEDDFSSNDDTKVPSQQSVKTYVDAGLDLAGNLSTGDIKETSFAGIGDLATDVDVTGLAFANGVVRSFDVIISVVVDATADLYEEFNIRGIQKGADWEISYDSVGDDSLVSFDITAAGQVTYSKTTTTGWVSTTMKFRADTVGV